MSEEKETTRAKWEQPELTDASEDAAEDSRDSGAKAWCRPHGSCRPQTPGGCRPYSGPPGGCRPYGHGAVTGGCMPYRMCYPRQGGYGVYPYCRPYGFNYGYGCFPRR